MRVTRETGGATDLTESASTHGTFTQSRLCAARIPYTHLLQDLGTLRFPFSITSVDPPLFAITDRSTEGIRDGAEYDLLLVLLEKGRQGYEGSVVMGALRRSVRGLSGSRKSLGELIDLGRQRGCINAVGSKQVGAGSGEKEQVSRARLGERRDMAYAPPSTLDPEATLFVLLLRPDAPPRPTRPRPALALANLALPLRTSSIPELS